jgi:hypothetical protein
MPIRNDDARKAYFRDYMRKRRAGVKPEPKKPKPERGPDWEDIDRQVAGWKKYPGRRPVWAYEVMDRRAEFDMSTEEGSQAFGRLYLKAHDDHLAERKAQREKEARRDAEYEAERKIKRCSLCGESQSEVRMLWGDERTLICEPCAKEAVAAFAKFRETAS